MNDERIRSGFTEAAPLPANTLSHSCFFRRRSSINSEFANGFKGAATPPKTCRYDATAKWAVQSCHEMPTNSYVNATLPLFSSSRRLAGLTKLIHLVVIVSYLTTIGLVSINGCVPGPRPEFLDFHTVHTKPRFPMRN